MEHTEFEASHAIEDRLARGLMTWGLVGGAVGCMGGVLWAGVEGALCGGTVLSALAIAVSCVLIAQRMRRAPAHASLDRERQDSGIVRGEIAVTNTAMDRSDAELGAPERRDRGA